MTDSSSLVRIVQQVQPDEIYNLSAQSEAYGLRDFVDVAARKLGIGLKWSGKGVEEKALDDLGRTVVAVNPNYFRHAEVDTLLGDPSKAKAKLGWSAKVSFEQLVEEMVTEDLKSAERDELVKRHGHRPYDFHE